MTGWNDGLLHRRLRRAKVVNGRKDAMQDFAYRRSLFVFPNEYKTRTSEHDERDLKSLIVRS